MDRHSPDMLLWGKLSGSLIRYPPWDKLKGFETTKPPDYRGEASRPHTLRMAGEKYRCCMNMLLPGQATCPDRVYCRNGKLRESMFPWPNPLYLDYNACGWRIKTIHLPLITSPFGQLTKQDLKCLEQIFQSICMDCSFSSALSVYSLYFHWLKTWAVLWMQTGRSWSSRTHGRKEVAREIKIFTKAALPAGRQGQRQ